MFRTCGACFAEPGTEAGPLQLDPAKPRRTAMTKRDEPRKWSAEVTKYSDALDLEPDVFESKNPKKIAQSLKKSAEHSQRRKAGPFRSAMSMLTFYINRAGKNLSSSQRNVLEAAKNELRAAFGRDRK
jgi:hypothetical protein